MIHLLVDTSVLIKWFHSEGESELTEARAIRDAHVLGRVEAHILDLAIYEIGNVLGRALRWPAADVAAQIDDVLAVVGTPLAMSQNWLHVAARLTETHALSFYDASWAAAAVALGIPLVSADRKLVDAGLASSATTVVSTIGISG